MPGQFGGFDPHSYAFSDHDLRQIIQRTDAAKQEMKVVNSMVTAHTEALVSANQSDSGQILQQHLTTWTADFNRVVTNLDDINTKAKALLQVNRSAAANSAAAAK
jgi:hypothetical protein